MRFLWCAAPLLLAALLPYPATARDRCARRAIIERPDWLIRPSVDALWGYYPHPVLRLRTSGRAVLICNTEADGFLFNCGVIEERRAGVRYGEAAQIMTRRARIRLPAPSARSMNGAMVRVTIIFQGEREGSSSPPQIRGRTVRTPIPPETVARAPCLDQPARR